MENTPAKLRCSIEMQLCSFTYKLVRKSFVVFNRSHIEIGEKCTKAFNEFVFQIPTRFRVAL